MNVEFRPWVLAVVWSLLSIGMVGCMPAGTSGSVSRSSTGASEINGSQAGAAEESCADDGDCPRGTIARRQPAWPLAVGKRAARRALKHHPGRHLEPVFAMSSDARSRNAEAHSVSVAMARSVSRWATLAMRVHSHSTMTCLSRASRPPILWQGGRRQRGLMPR